MKKVISGKEMEAFVQSEQKVMEIDPSTIVTPFAADMAKNYGIQIIHREETSESHNIAELTNQVMQVMRQMGFSHPATRWVEENSASGMRVIKGNSVFQERLSIGHGDMNIYGSQIALGSSGAELCFLSLEDGTLQQSNHQKQVLCVTSGDIYVRDGDEKYHAFSGDVIYIPENCDISWQVSGRATVVILRFA